MVNPCNFFYDWALSLMCGLCPRTGAVSTWDHEVFGSKQPLIKEYDEQRRI
jgi:hypothetical protein